MKALSASSVLVLGLGESGLAMARWCSRQGARVRVADTRDDPPGLATLAHACPAAERVLGPFGEQLLDGIDLLALSPGIDPSVAVVAAARARGIAICGEMSLFAAALDELGERPRIIAITGTNGKTTTTALTAALCRAAGFDAVAAGNISPAALGVLADRLDAGTGLPDCWVLELSSFQLETMQGLEPDAATVLNVTDDHLDRHGNLENYAAVKARIFAGGGTQVINRDDPRVGAMASDGRRVIGFGAGAPPSPADFGIVRRGDGDWLARGDVMLLPVGDMRLAGRHNHCNALAARAGAGAVGAAIEPMLAELRAFGGLAHRVEAVARRTDGVVFYDDSKGTNVGATLAALEGLGRPVVLIAGGDGKGQDFSPLRKAVAEHGRAVVLIGRDAAVIERALEGCGPALVHAPDMSAAVAAANRLAQAGDAVLLSPACASLDMFRSYAHRAEVFVAAVKSLPGVVAQ